MYVYEYDLHTGGLGQRQEFATIDPALGYLDGLTVDRSGDVWVAVWEGGHLRRYSPSGRLRGIFALPVSHPTCPAFGGAALDTLFVTSARVATAIEAEEPWAGHVFFFFWPGSGRGVASRHTAMAARSLDPKENQLPTTKAFQMTSTSTNPSSERHARSASPRLQHTSTTRSCSAQRKPAPAGPQRQDQSVLQRCAASPMRQPMRAGT